MWLGASKSVVNTGRDKLEIEEILPDKTLDQPASLVLSEQVLPAHPARELRPGDLCPECCTGHMDYDGLLNLACPICGYALGGCFT